MSDSVIIKESKNLQRRSVDIRTFNLLGEQVVIDEPKERYRDLMEFGEGVRCEVYCALNDNYPEKEIEAFLNI